MKVLGALIEPKTVKEANKPEIMVPMEMRNKNMVDLAPPYFIQVHLHLRAFATINQKSMIQGLDYLGRRMPVMSRYCRIISQNSYRKQGLNLVLNI